jgi:hypothetical protein
VQSAAAVPEDGRFGLDIEAAQVFPQPDLVFRLEVDAAAELFGDIGENR